MANKANFAALPSEALNECARTVEEDIPERAETIASALFIASLFDKDVCQAAVDKPTDTMKSLQKAFRDGCVALPDDCDSHEIITGIIEFAKLFCSLPKGQNPPQHLQGSVDATQKWIKESDDVVIGKIAYRNLDHRLVKTIYDSYFPARMTVKKTEGVHWKGGSLEYFIQSAGAGTMVTTLYYSTERARRLTDLGRKILRGIMKDVEKTHEENKSYGNLSISTIYLTQNWEVVLPCPVAGNASSIKADRDILCGLVQTIIGEEGEELPEDVQHLCQLLKAEDQSPESKHVRFNHPCLWYPEEMVRNIYIFQLMCMLNRKKGEMVKVHQGRDKGKEYFQSKLAEIANKGIPQKVTKDWIPKLGLGPYKKSYDKWMAEINSKQADYASLIALSDAIAILIFMRNCFVHIHESIGNSAKQTTYDTEEHLFVLFPDFMSHFVSAMVNEMGFAEYCRLW